MNWADFGLGTWHPKGGMYRIVEGMVNIAESLGVEFHTDASVEKIKVDPYGKAKGVIVNGNSFSADIVLSGADYHHTETLLDPEYRVYSENYWDKKVFSPSSLLFYIGLNKKVDNVYHHNLFFDVDFDKHAEAIYDNPKWPEEPLFYANFPSVSDSSMAPDGKEACFLLIPIAPGIEDTPELRTHYYDLVMNRLEKLTGQDLIKNVEFIESFCIKDFEEDYNSYKGNAYGLANTLLQTAFLRPKLKSKKVNNLFFAGQLTVPGPGVPPALISGKLVAELIIK
jgi:phytoene desaturase